MMSKLSLVEDDAVDLLRELPAKQERQLRGWVDDINRVLAADVAKPVVEQIARVRKCHPNTVYNKVNAAKELGIRGLVDSRWRVAKAKTKAIVLSGHRSALFKGYVQDYYFEFDRNNGGEEVYRQILSDWRKWLNDPYNPKLAIPGYTNPPPSCPKVKHAHPAGWSKSNIAKLKPTEIELAHARRGPQARNLHLSPIRTSRYGLEVGQIYMFDDQEYDNYVIFKKQKTRPLGLTAIDVFSGRITAAGYKPKQRDAIKGEKSLNSRDTLWFIVHILTSVGYLETGTQIVCESGTGSISKPFAQRILEATNGCVTVHSGEVSKEKIRGLQGLCRGNPRHKPGMESLFNRMRNAFGFLPAPTGRNKDEQHEGTVALLREETALYKRASQFLPDNRLGDLIKRVLPWSRFVPVANAVNEIINHSPNHKLEAWEKLGFKTVEYLVGDEWVNEEVFHQLSDERQDIVLARDEAGQGTIRERNLTRHEVFEFGKKNLKPLDPFRWPILIPEEFALKRKVPANSELIINDKDFDFEPIILKTFMLTTGGESIPVPPNKNVLVYLNPYAPEYAVLCNADRSLLGLVERLRTGTRFDEELLERQYGDRNKMKRIATAGSSRFNAQKEQQRDHENAYNDAIIETGDAPIIDITPDPEDQPQKPTLKDESLSDFAPPQIDDEDGDEWDDFDLPTIQ